MLKAVLFQTPSFNFSLNLLRRLTEVPNIVGMKGELGDMKQFVRQWKAAGDRIKLMCGVGEILAPSYFARVQAVNLTNTAYFNNPNVSCGTYSSAALPCNNLTSGTFGQVTSTNSLAREGLDQRQFEFSAKLSP